MMCLRSRLGVALLLLFGCVLALNPAVANAETNSSSDNVQLTLSPTSLRIALQPEKIYDGTFTVINSGQKGFTFKAYTQSYHVADEDYNPIFGKDRPQSQIARWISFDKAEYSLKPGEKVAVKYTIKVPKDIASVGQHAAIFAETTGEEDASSSIVTKKRVGLIVYGTVQGGHTREGGELLSSEASFWQQQALINAKARIKNTGNVDITTTSKMTVKSIFGGATVYESDQVERPVLSETIRALPFEAKNLGIGLYTVETQVKFLGETHVDTHTVLLAPTWLVILVSIIVVILISGGGYAIYKKIRR